MLMENWYGMLAPAGTPANVQATLEKAMLEAMKSPMVAQRLAAGGVVGGTDGKGFADRAREGRGLLGAGAQEARHQGRISRERRVMKWLRCLCLVVGGGGRLSATARAQDYPNKPIRLIIATAAGGLMDVAARVAADSLDKSLGQRLVIENRPGSGGNIGAEAVAKAEPDGYTLGLVQIGNVAINPYVYPDMTFDPFTDLVPVAPLTSSAILVVANAKVPANDLQRADRARQARARQAVLWIVRATAPRRISRAKCSRRRPASTSCTCPIVARAPR